MARRRKTRRNPSAQRLAQPRDPHRRSQVMATRVSPLEQQDIMSRAAEAQLSSSDFLRRAALRQAVTAPSAKPLPQFRPTYLPLVRELNAVGINLNQLTRVANATGYLPPSLAYVLADINTLLDKLIDLEGT
jgi:hypothetical protein